MHLSDEHAADAERGRAAAGGVHTASSAGARSGRAASLLGRARAPDEELKLVGLRTARVVCERERDGLEESFDVIALISLGRPVG